MDKKPTEALVNPVSRAASRLNFTTNRASGKTPGLFQYLGESMNHNLMPGGSRIGTRSLVPNAVALLLAACALMIPRNAHGGIAADSAKHWVGTWAAAAYIVEAANMPPSPGLTSNTLRQVVRVSIGGDTLRLKLSNANNTTAVTLQSVNIAVAGTASNIEASTIVPLKFNGSASTTLSAGGAATSDPVAFKRRPTCAWPSPSITGRHPET